MLYDREFLLKLDKIKHKIIYARITSLTFSETPIEYIEGRVTQGSINIDGASAVRRTCSLTMVAEEFDYNDYYWGLNTKFKLEIGVENTVDPSYPNIIWFKQGIFLITSFNTSRSTNNFSISIQGKDKMCLLNGEVGGSLESSVDFGTIEEEDENGIWTIKQIPLFDIIKNAVHVYGGEPYHNIIINDLDGYGLELLEYRYDAPLYLYRSDGDLEYKNITLDQNKKCQVYKDDGFPETEIITFAELDVKHLEPLVDRLLGDSGLGMKIKIYKSNGEPEDGMFYVAKVEYGQTAGYKKRDLTFAGDLIANIGESVTSVLDKIKNMLVEFEYFYDLDGRFVFQKKQSFISTMWSDNTEKEEEEVSRSLALSSTNSYIFGGGELITAFNNNPNLLNLRNDYSVWGERNSVSGIKIPVHMRYAIDKKPDKYTTISIPNDHKGIIEYNKKYGTSLTGQTSKTYISSNGYLDTGSVVYCDWREVIYQMALDYFKYNQLDDFELLIATANPIDYPRGRTDYEQYYTDLQGFWRELYYPKAGNSLNYYQEQLTILDSQCTQIQQQLYGNTIDNWFGYTTLLQRLENATSKEESDIITIVADVKANVARYEPENLTLFQDENGIEMTDIEKIKGKFKTFINELSQDLSTSETNRDKCQIKVDEEKELQKTFYSIDNNDYPCWNKDVYLNPELLNFWFDFLDTSGALAQFSVRAIGARPKSINDTQVKSIYYRETPSVIFKDSNDVSEQIEGFRYIQTGGFDEMFVISSQGKSAKDRLDELLYQHGYCVESATITTIPIYYLEPNTRIYLYDKETNLQGDYIVNKITIPLAYNGTMSISATKAAQDIL